MRRIYNEYTSDLQVFFVTLTYNRDSSPYIKFSDLEKKTEYLPIYRDVKLVRSFGSSHLEKITNIIDYELVDYANLDLNKLKPLKHRKHNIGVTYYKDQQDFFKRLKSNLKRLYNYNGYFKYFVCSEYGESTLRPHFHALLFFDKGNEDAFRDSILKSWPYADKNRMLRGIEIPTDATAYVSSYVNSPADFPLFLSDNFPAKHSFSKYLGTNLDSFSLPKIIQKIRVRDLRYSTTVMRGNVREVINLPLPSYVINRYFPKFKGFSRLTRSEVLDVLHYPCRLSEYKDIMDYTDDDLRNIPKVISKRYYNYFKPLGYNFEDFCLFYVDVWSIRQSNMYKDFMLDKTVPMLQKYDNLYELDYGSVHSDLKLPIGYNVNPNKFKFRVEDTNYWTQKFSEKIKRKKVSDVVQNGIY